MKNLAITLIMSILLMSCTDFTDTIPIYKIQSDMDPFVNSFFNEASKRGLHLEKENLFVSTSETNNTLLPIGAAGNFIEIGGQRYVTLWTGAFYYFLNSDKKPAEAERLIFHEIGHAFGRGHNNNPNSIMCQCMPSDYYVGNDSLRTMAINELMNGIHY